MDERHFKELLEKYLAGSASLQETKDLEAFFYSYQQEAAEGQYKLPPELASRKEEIFETIAGAMQARRRRTLYPKI